MNDSQRRLPLNVFANLGVLLAGIGVGVWQTPFLIDRLGVPAYGQIGLLRSISDYGMLAAFTMTACVHRFVAMGVNAEDWSQASRYYASAFSALLVLCGTTLLLGVGVQAWLPAWIGSPTEYHGAIRGLFMLMLLSSCLGVLNGPFMSIPLARHRFDLIGAVRLTGFVIQVGLLLILFAMGSAALTFVGWAYVGKECVVLSGAVWLSVAMAPKIRLALRHVDWQAVREMVGMSLWAVVDRVGFLLYFSVDLLVINLLLGNLATGHYAPITQLGTLLSMFIVAVTNVFWPIAYEHVAKNRIVELTRAVLRTTKFMGLVIALPVGLLCGLAGPFLEVWLGAQWRNLGPLLILLITPYAINYALQHLYSVTHAMNLVRVPALVTVAGGVLNLLLSVVLVKWTPLGLYGVALATGIALTMRNVGFMAWYISRILNVSVTSILRGLVPGMVVTAVLGGCGRLAAEWFALEKLLHLGVAAVVLGCIYMALCAAMFSRGDWGLLKTLLASRQG